MKISNKWKKVTHDGASVNFKRDDHGVIHLKGTNLKDYAFGLGIAHGTDRSMQMIFTRTIANGRACEILDNKPELLQIDIFMRDLGIAYQSKKELSKLSPEVKDFLVNYSNGVNRALEDSPSSIFKLVGHRPEPWTPADTLSTMRIMAYVGLAQTQQTMEKFLIQLIKAGSPLDNLKALFSPHLDNIDEKTVELIKNLNIFWESIPSLDGIPTFKNSNNWSIAPMKSQSGSTIHCNDPHLEGNRLPSVWQEIVYNHPNGYVMGASMPGVPGIAMGRTQDVGFGFTYGFMDTIDYFIETIEDHSYKIEDHFHALNSRVETIKRKNSTDYKIEVYETTNGVLERDYNQNLKDGLYLSRAWSGYGFPIGKTIEALMNIPFSKNAIDAAKECSKVFISCNWVLSDKKGNLVYQQSGYLPKRKDSGLFPLDGSKKENHWEKIHEEDQLARFENPKEGFIATANDDLNEEGKPLSINLPMGPYRADRIKQLLSKKEKLDVIDMKAIQSDLYSLQAEKFMKLWEEFIPDTPSGKLLKSWDLRYCKNSKAPYLFEKIYVQLLEDFYADHIHDRKSWEYLLNETCLFIDFYYFFDLPFLEDQDLRFKKFFIKKSKKEYFKQAIEKVLMQIPFSKIKKWGEVNSFSMNHIMLGDTALGKLLFNKGPYPIDGNRATIVQGQVYRTGGRQSSFCPSWRFISDFSTDGAFTILAGGPSEKRFSKYYNTEVKRWLNYQYKHIHADKGDI